MLAFHDFDNVIVLLAFCLSSYLDSLSLRCFECCSCTPVARAVDTVGPDAPVEGFGRWKVGGWSVRIHGREPDIDHGRGEGAGRGNLQGVAEGTGVEVPFEGWPEAGGSCPTDRREGYGPGQFRAEVPDRRPVTGLGEAVIGTDTPVVGGIGIKRRGKGVLRGVGEGIYHEKGKVDPGNLQLIMMRRNGIGPIQPGQVVGRQGVIGWRNLAGYSRREGRSGTGGGARESGCESGSRSGSESGRRGGRERERRCWKLMLKQE